MHVIRHETVAQQRKTVKLGILPQQLEVGDAVGVVGQNDLPGVSALGNMMSNVNHDDASEAGHGQKNSRKDRIGGRISAPSQARKSSPFPTLGGKNGERPVCPRFRLCYQKWGTFRLSPDFADFEARRDREKTPSCDPPSRVSGRRVCTA